jgi:hypothetical protein
MAQLRPVGLPPPAAAPRPLADPDPDEVGSTLSLYYHGIRRAEAEETAAGPPDTGPVPGPASHADPAEKGDGADGE